MLKKSLLGLAAVTAMALTTGCASTVGSLFVSESDEASLGAKFDQNVRDSTTTYPLYTSGSSTNGDAVLSYVQSVFNTVKTQVPSDEMPSYGFQSVKLIKDTATVNAFAVPGGYVYVYTGILLSVENEAELAAVLGHEMTHVVHHHYREQLAETYGTELLLEMLGTPSTLNSLATSLFSLKFSRSNESDADSNGIMLTAHAGYYPLGISTFFSRMGSSGIAILSDHPSNEDRVTAGLRIVKRNSLDTTQPKCVICGLDGIKAKIRSGI